MICQELFYDMRYILVLKKRFFLFKQLVWVNLIVDTSNMHGDQNAASRRAVHQRIIRPYGFISFQRYGMGNSMSDIKNSMNMPETIPNNIIGVHSFKLTKLN